MSDQYLPSALDKENEKTWLSSKARPQRRRKGYGRHASDDSTKRKKRALRERHCQSFNEDYDRSDPAAPSDDKSSMASLESTVCSTSSMSSFSDFGKTRRLTCFGSSPEKSLPDFDVENCHPNINRSTPLPPSKVKKTNSHNVGKKLLTRSNSCTNAVLSTSHLSNSLPLKRACSLKFPSGRHSPAFSNTSSISSFSSIAKTESSWALSKTILQQASHAIKQRDNTIKSQELDSDHDFVEMSITPCPNKNPTSICRLSPVLKTGHDLCTTFASPSTPERTRRTESMPKKGVCDSPSINSYDMASSIPSTGSPTYESNSSTFRSKFRSRNLTQSARHQQYVESSQDATFMSFDSSNQYSKRNLRIRNVESSESDNDDSFKNEKVLASDDESQHISQSSSGDLSFVLPFDDKKQQKNCYNPTFKSKIDQLISPLGQEQLKRKDIDVKLISSHQDLKYIVKALKKIKSNKNMAGFGNSNNWTIVVPHSWSPSRKNEFLHWTAHGLGFQPRAAGGGISYILITREKGSFILEHLESTLEKLKLNSIDDKQLKNTITTKSENIPKDSIFRIPVKPPKSIPGYFPKTTATAIKTTETKSESTIKVRVSPEDVDVEIELLDNDLYNLTLSNQDEGNNNIVDCNSVQEASSKCSTQERSFVRIVTLDAPSSIVSSYSPKDDSFEIQRRSRLSGEHVQGSQELLQHCHGISPPNCNTRPRPKKLNILNPYHQTRPFDTFSPHTIDSQTSYSVHDNNVINTSGTAVFDLSKIETPMPRKCARTWGSRPIRGKDWGLSKQCKSSDISILYRKFKDSFCEYDVQIDESSMFYSCQMKGIRSFEDQAINAMAVTTADLRFDDEVDTSIDESIAYDERPDILPDDKWVDKRRRNTNGSSSNSLSTKMAQSLQEINKSPQCKQRKRIQSIAKHKRISLCSSFLDLDDQQQSFERFNFTPTNKRIESKVSPNIGLLTSRVSSTHICSPFFPRMSIDSPPTKSFRSPDKECHLDHESLCHIFGFLDETTLLCTITLVCTNWSNAAMGAYAKMASNIIRCVDDHDSFEEKKCVINSYAASKVSSMEKSWSTFLNKYPFGKFLSEGSFKQVFRVWNSRTTVGEAISIMDINMIESMGNKDAIASELYTSILLSSLSRRHICPNFVIIRDVFTCSNKPPELGWEPINSKKDVKTKKLKEVNSCPTDSSSLYQYIRMELCEFGDVEGFIRNQPKNIIHPEEARIFLFQMAFSLHVAGDKFGLKHYDVKLLNFLLQSANKNDVDIVSKPFTALRYGFGEHIFYLRMQTSRAFIVKLADYGTSNMHTKFDGQPITLAQFTTLENSPPEFLLFGDNATQGYGHDCFALGLCMVHLFTGHVPYEEILEEVLCPPLLLKKIRKIWESNKPCGYEVIKSVILADVYVDEDGNIEGSSDEILYHTLYRYLVLFGIPTELQKARDLGSVWRAITTTLTSKRVGFSIARQYHKDQEKFSFYLGNDPRIVKARDNLSSLKGGIELLKGLTSFDPNKRWNPLDVINSSFMAPLRETSIENQRQNNDIVHSFMEYKTHPKFI